MKRILKITILFLSCICACWLLPACSSDIEEPGNGGGNDGSTVTLTIQAALPNGTRAGGDELPEREKIDQLRIIVVDNTSQKVEYNSLEDFPNRDGSSYNIEVTKNGTKLVYFLANTESLTNLSNLPSKGQAWNETAIDDYVLNQLPENRLPFTSKYEIEVEEEDVTETCYIAIAAVKFDIVFNNNTTNKITVSSLEIGAIADQSYLFPHNNEWDKWVTNITGSNTNKDYFTNYDIPESAEHKNFPVPIPSTSGGDDTQGNAGGGSGNSSFNVSAKNGETPGSCTIPTFYCHESKNFPLGVKEQRYIIQFMINDRPYVSEITNSGEYLESLIRSTHVIITVNINALDERPGNIVIWGKIEDWIEGEEVEGGLEPVQTDLIW